MLLRLTILFPLLLQTAWSQTPLDVDALHYIRPGDDPQAICDAAPAGSKLVFLPGEHEHPLRKHRSLLYVDKSIDIELMEGAILRLADNQTTLELEPELTIDHGAVKTLDDLTVGGLYDGGLGPVIFTIKIDGQGSAGQPDSFAWVHGWGPGATQGAFKEKVLITGEWQPLSHGIQIKFDSRSGHSLGSFWALSYDGRESYGIRVGYGTQSETIENVRVYGRGTIDMNRDRNVQPSELVKNISASVLLHGRVRNVSIEQVTMINTFRSVMAYGEHTGEFLRGGGTQGGESFDAENIAIIGTRTLNPEGKAYLLGHPSHRGRLTNVQCNYNYMETHGTALEPNFNLSQYEVIGNIIKSGGRAIHCWRKSTDGLIKNNVRLDDTTGKVARPPEHQSEVVMVNSPGAWEDPENLILRDNLSYLSNSHGYWATVSGGLDNQAQGAFSNVGGGRNNVVAGAMASVAGGEENRANGRGASVTGGMGNVSDAPYSRAHGLDARAQRPAEDVLSSGAFESAGDAQTSRLVAKALTTGNGTASLSLAEGAPLVIGEGATVAYRILAVARGKGGGVHAVYEAKGLAQRELSGALSLRGNRELVIHESEELLDFRVVSDTTTGELGLQAQGVADTSIRWVAEIELVEVRF